ncbi:MAG: glycoside hydrolase family 27 protein [Lachnospiraceae bacterium]|jgi:hypothetical protein|nr:glycoside hydrolase family 27 protein [Lachnospiraceae bacterium]
MRKNKTTFAPTPPMGWNSWDCYAATVNEEQLLGNAAYMAKHMKQHGWEYIVCDIQWSDPLAGTEAMEYRPFAALEMDDFSRLMPARSRFPSTEDGGGFTTIAAKIHEMGLKFGIHIMRGIPRQAAHHQTPIMGGEWTADEIADPFSICKWNSDMYGLKAGHPGAQVYYNSLFSLYASWGVDFVKVDDIANTNIWPQNPYSAQYEIEMMRKAIDSCGREMVLSLSPGPAPIAHARHLGQNADMWRMTDDFWDRWDLLKDMFARCEVWQTHVGDGGWPDCDMLPLGRIGIGHRDDRRSRFTRDEQQTMMTLWSIFRSPLMMGGEMRDNDEWTLSLLTNDEVLAVNKCENRAWQIARDDSQAIWANRDGKTVYLALFNLSDEEKRVSCPLAEVVMWEASVRNLWEHTDEGIHKREISYFLRPHASVLLRLTV